jgi:hypothetical protein
VNQDPTSSGTFANRVVCVRYSLSQTTWHLLMSVGLGLQGELMLYQGDRSGSISQLYRSLDILAGALRDVCARFVEGFETSDLRIARSLLEETRPFGAP